MIGEKTAPWARVPLDGELRFAGDSGFADRELTEFAASFANDPSITDDETIAAVKGYVRRHGELVAPSPLSIGKRELEHNFAFAKVAEESGFPNASYFHRAFRAWLGMTPMQARARIVADGLAA